MELMRLIRSVPNWSRLFTSFSMLALDSLRSATLTYLMERVDIDMIDEVSNKCSPPVPGDECRNKREFMCDLKIQQCRN
jgi:hypothetical protein